MMASEPPQNTTPTRRPARRSGRNRKTTKLADSFKEYVDSTPVDEVDELSLQLQHALAAISGPTPAAEAANGAPVDVTASCLGRVQHHDGRGRTFGSSMIVKSQPRRERSMSPIRVSGEEFYMPKSSSRRNSRAGSELAISMKITAQKALAEMGEVSDDEDEDLFKLGAIEGLDSLREESIRGILREGSNYGC